MVSAGWVIQDKSEFNRHAAIGVAVREFQLPVGPCNWIHGTPKLSAGTTAKVWGGIWT
ncbi:MAG: hypothetical protein WC222_03750 [Parachlamydiales bacterium]